jgi:spore coat protein U-like protein
MKSASTTRGGIWFSLVIVMACVGFTANAKAANCSWRSVTGVSFGIYNVFSTSPLDSTGTLTYRCSGGTGNVTIDLDRGNSTSFDPRFMLRTTEHLNYNLYLDASRAVIWGDATSGTTNYAIVDPPNGSNVSVTIYGRVPAGQDVTVGSYTDTIIATISF